MYPIHLNLTNKSVVIAGGGNVALRKTQALLGTGADITVVSPAAVSKIKELHTQKKIRWMSRKIEAIDFQDAFLVVAATNDISTNSWIASNAGDQQLINVADQPDLGNFIVPSIVKRGKLIFSISTSGSSPTLTKKIKKELEDTYSEDYESYVDFLYECRVLVKEHYEGHEKRNVLEELMNREFLQSEKLRENIKQQLINNASTKIEY